MAKDNRVTIRLTDSDREWLDGLSAKSGLTITEVIREVLKLARMSNSQAKAYHDCLEYLQGLEPENFLSGLDELISQLQEVKANGK
ncbi:hypothetical protein H6G74_15515 [Nostoc spongiaeforme FACHB-130]|uniref:Ribbon-helix-helix protein CopG domain-containing protein n=1 Tax=Nostoc spongiaeforme FACHB-130 TaxID=1357510 RepID=A0ABR8FWB9_9NOSO|nr:hypothetical protein [Nostoc spongiaeforme]MBD2595725.1 hypothetical protein [Nostoc spongiaeforme FACHB-130]